MLVHRFATQLATLCMLLMTHAIGWGGELAQLRLDQVQMVGTHNSYHLAPVPVVMQMLSTFDPKLSKALDYSREPLAEQLDKLGVRQLELDLFADPEGGRYADPAALRKAFPKLPPIDDHNGAMLRPGLKVMHVQDIDQRTTVATFVRALTEVRDWLRANTDQGPILLLLETKEGREAPFLTEPLPITAETFADIEQEILSVFDREEVFAPDDLRGEHTTLREAVLAKAWPSLAELRGKVLFKIDGRGHSQRYVKAWPTLAGRLLFPDLAESHPAAAIMNRNNPVKDFDEIRRLVQLGYLVRTRADSGTVEARTGDTTRRERAFDSGAQFISTDYPQPDPRFTDYHVTLQAGQTVRPNPVTGHPM